MPYYALLYALADDYVSRRAAFREGHLELARAAHARGEIVLAGAFADPADNALLVFRAPDASVATRFAQQDPYVLNGLVKRWIVRQWNVVIGNDPD
ncbi:MAG: YciI-like protein [Terriglobales bacterium]